MAKTRRPTRATRKAQKTQTRKPKPRQVRLPGTEDSAINAIEKAAFRYIDARDERMELTEREVACKQDLLAEMHKARKDHYQRGQLSVDIVPEGETVKARLKKAKDADDPGDGEPFNPPATDPAPATDDDPEPEAVEEAEF
jgi:hypothetical protein